METHLKPSVVRGQITAPSSKSMTQRAIAAALLSDGLSTIRNPSYCNDSLAAIGIARNLGALIQQKDNELIIRGHGILKETELNCGESGLAIRMFSPVAAMNSEEIIMNGEGSLTRRPMKMIEEALNQLGAVCKTNGGFLPLTVKGPMKGGSCNIDGSISSQLLTGLLMALPLAGTDSEIVVTNLKSKPYIDMTIQILNAFGIVVQNSGYETFIIPSNQKYLARGYEVEGDWSGGAFLLVAGAVNGSLTVHGLRNDSKQSDVAILTALEKAGAQINISDNKIDIEKSSLRAFEFNATECPDLFPPLVSLASYCPGITIIRGTSRLVHKESDRAVSLQQEFGKMNITIEMKDDLMFVTGGQIKGTETDSHNDHRIAMAIAIASLGASSGMMIRDSQCVGKSYPGFFNDLKKIGVVIQD